MTQADLFLTYPDKPGHVRDSDTSEAAANSIDAANMRGAIKKLLRQCGPMTCDKAEELTGWSHQSVSPRFRELHMKGEVRIMSEDGITRSGRAARVYALADDRTASR